MGIHLSKKHGVNPSIEICAVCGTLIIETVDDEQYSKNPTRTGRIVGITHEAAERLFHSHAPVAYMVHTDFTNIFGESFN